jgi:hypothetical protein
MLKVERQQGQPSRRRPGWMDGITPVDEEGMGGHHRVRWGETPPQQDPCGPDVAQRSTRVTPSLPFVLPGTFSRASAGQRTVSIRG